MDKRELLDVLEEQIIKEKEEKDAYGETDTWIGGYKDGRIDALTFAAKKAEWLDEPENPVVPKEFDEWYKEIQKKWSGNLAEQFALWKICQFGFGHGFEDARNRRIGADSLTNWVTNYKRKAIDAVLNGYIVEKEPMWVVRWGISYVIRFEIDSFSEWQVETSTNKDDALKFKNKIEPQEVADYIDGIVEKWSE